MCLETIYERPYTYFLGVSVYTMYLNTYKISPVFGDQQKRSSQIGTDKM